MRLEDTQRSPKEVMMAAQNAVDEEFVDNISEAKKEQEKGDIATVNKLSQWIYVYNKELAEILTKKDLRGARTTMLELASAVNMMQKHVDLLACQMGLPPLKV